MQIQHRDFTRSAPLRAALKRGLARQAMDHAAAAPADPARVMDYCASSGTSPTAEGRLVRRLQSQPGLVSIRRGAQGLVLVLRSPAEVLTRSAGTDVFTETALLYTRLTMIPSRRGTAFEISRASFCRHAVERFVERGTAPLDGPVLPHLDAEAVALLSHLRRATPLTDAGDEFVPSAATGLWAGSIDHSAPDPAWPVVWTADAPPVPTFSARTFLGPDQMRPTLWLAWSRLQS